jgi:hypothetical protein
MRVFEYTHTHTRTHTLTVAYTEAINIQGHREAFRSFPGHRLI